MARSPARPSPALEQSAMDRALRLARRGLRNARPNPMVGAVVLAGGRVVGEGAHLRCGGPHAEVIALARAGRKARGSTLVVTLEPCAHQGRTPPCTDAILAAGVARVVVATRDPHPRVAGRGIRTLRRHGVEVSVGSRAQQAVRLNEGYFSTQLRGRPWVTLKIACTLDGRLAAADGSSRYISGPGTLALAHQLRVEHHAILVGRATVEADNPQLTARLVKGRSPVRMVLDTRGVLPAGRRVFDLREAPTIWVTGSSAPARKVQAMQRRGVAVWRCRSDRDGLSLPALLERMSQEGLQSLLVEGGASVATSLLRQGLVDRLMVVVAPSLLGAGNLSWLGDLGIRSMRGLRSLGDPRVRVMGGDALFEGTFTPVQDLLPLGASR